MSIFDSRFMERRHPYCSNMVYNFSHGDARDLFHNHNGSGANGIVFSGGEAIFDGTDDVITLASQSHLQLGEKFSILVWFKPNFVGTTRRCLYTKGGQVASRSVIFRIDPSNTRYVCQVDTTGAATTASTYTLIWTTTIPTSGWHFAVMTYNNSLGATAKIKLYINGVSSGQATSGGTAGAPFVNNSDFCFGGDNTTNQDFKGSLKDYVVLNNYALSDAEVRDFYYNTLKT